MALRITNAVEVLPVPDGPQNKQALGYGLAQNFSIIRFGLSRPTNLETADSVQGPVTAARLAILQFAIASFPTS